jgi:hypothetical protein
MTRHRILVRGLASGLALTFVCSCCNLAEPVSPTSAAGDENERDEPARAARPSKTIFVPVPLPVRVNADWVFGPGVGGAFGEASPSELSEQVKAAITKIDPNLPAAAVLRGNIFAQNGLYDLLYDAYQRDPKVFRDYCSVMSLESVRAVVRRLLDEKRTGDAINLCRRLLIIHGRPRPDSDLARVVLMLGDAYFQEERYEVARDEYTTVVTMWPKIREAQYAKMKVVLTLIRQKIYGKAREILEELEASKDTQVSMRAQLMTAALYCQVWGAEMAEAKLDDCGGVRRFDRMPDLLRYQVTAATPGDDKTTDLLRFLDAYLRGCSPRRDTSDRILTDLYSRGVLRVRERGDRIRVTLRSGEYLAGNLIPIRVRTVSGHEGTITLEYGKGSWVAELPIKNEGGLQPPEASGGQDGAPASPNHAPLYFDRDGMLARPMETNRALEGSIQQFLGTRWAKSARGRPVACPFERIADVDETDMEPGDSECLILSPEAVEKRREIPRNLLFRASQEIAKGDLESARTRLQLTCLHALAAQSVDPLWNDHPLFTASKTLISIDEQLALERSREQPALAQRLNLIIRNQPLPEALADVARAAKVRISLVPGSEEDSKRLLLRDELNVVYLDLRGATVSEALNWLLGPLQMTWRVEGPRHAISMGTARRMSGDSPWVYDVSGILFPLAKELGGNEESRVDVAKQLIAKGTDSLLSVVRRIVPSSDEFAVEPGSAALIDASRLMVYGEPDVHRQVQSFLDALGDPKTDIKSFAGNKLTEEESEGLAWLREVAPARLAAYGVARKRTAQEAARQRAFDSLSEHAWGLPTEALAREEASEAFIHCQAAWCILSPGIAGCPVGSIPACTGREVAWDGLCLSDDDDCDSLLIATRSAYTALLACLANPDDAGMKKLACQITDSLPHLLSLARKSRNSSTSARWQRPHKLAQVYAILACNAAKMAGFPLHVEEKDKQMPSTGWCGCDFMFVPPTTEESVLLASAPSDLSKKALPESFERRTNEGDLHEDDAFVLKALAAKRCGEDVWQGFRRSRAALIERHKPSGSAILFVERLGGSKTIFWKEF